LINSQRVVIDTQTVLDWQFFIDPVCRTWTLPGPSAGWQWLATAAMRDELAHVLGRGFGPRWVTPTDQVLAFFDRHASLQLAAPPPAAWGRAMRCTDPDDQKFIDLAAASGAQWLISRDRAVLKLRKRAFALAQLRIASPAEWRPTALACEAAIERPDVSAPDPLQRFGSSK